MVKIILYFLIIKPPQYSLDIKKDMCTKNLSNFRLILRNYFYNNITRKRNIFYKCSFHLFFLI